jgi:uncharacterized membrane protein
MPVCSRCAGIFAGVAVGALVARPRFGMRFWRVAILVAAAIMLADVAAQDFGSHPPWHVTRLATGLAFGYALAASLITQIDAQRSGLGAGEVGPPPRPGSPGAV